MSKMKPHEHEDAAEDHRHAQHLANENRDIPHAAYHGFMANLHSMYNVSPDHPNRERAMKQAKIRHHEISGWKNKKKKIEKVM